MHSHRGWDGCGHPRAELRDQPLLATWLLSLEAAPESLHLFQLLNPLKWQGHPSLRRTSEKRKGLIHHASEDKRIARVASTVSKQCPDIVSCFYSGSKIYFNIPGGVCRVEGKMELEILLAYLGI